MLALMCLQMLLQDAQCRSGSSSEDAYCHFEVPCKPDTTMSVSSMVVWQSLAFRLQSQYCQSGAMSATAASRSALLASHESTNKKVHPKIPQKPNPKPQSQTNQLHDNTVQQTAVC